MPKGMYMVSPFTVEQFAHAVEMIAAEQDAETRIAMSADPLANSTCEIFEKYEQDFQWTPLIVEVARDLVTRLALSLAEKDAFADFILICTVLNSPRETWPHVVFNLDNGSMSLFGATFRTVSAIGEGIAKVRITDPAKNGRAFVAKRWAKRGFNPEFWKGVP